MSRSLRAGACQCYGRRFGSWPGSLWRSSNRMLWEELREMGRPAMALELAHVMGGVRGGGGARCGAPASDLDTSLVLFLLVFPPHSSLVLPPRPSFLLPPAPLSSLLLSPPSPPHPFLLCLLPPSSSGSLSPSSPIILPPPSSFSSAP